MLKSTHLLPFMCSTYTHTYIQIQYTTHNMILYIHVQIFKILNKCDKMYTELSLDCSWFLLFFFIEFFLKRKFIIFRTVFDATMVKNLAANAGDTRDVGLIPGLERSPEEGNGNPLQYSCLGNPMDSGAWWAVVHKVAKSWTQLSDWAAHTHTYTHTKKPKPVTSNNNNNNYQTGIPDIRNKSDGICHTNPTCSDWLAHKLSQV